jgi:hypothetical protein
MGYSKFEIASFVEALEKGSLVTLCQLFVLRLLRLEGVGVRLAITYIINSD